LPKSQSLETQIKTQMNKEGEPQDQNSLGRNWLVSIMKHKNLAFAGVFVFFVVGFFALSSINANKAEAAISLKAAGTWNTVITTDNVTVAIPGAPAAGDRMFLFASWKNYATTLATPNGWNAIGTEFADGSVSTVQATVPGL
jgi:hypothetical protein